MGYEGKTVSARAVEYRTRLRERRSKKKKIEKFFFKGELYHVTPLVFFSSAEALAELASSKHGQGETDGKLTVGCICVCEIAAEMSDCRDSAILL